MGPTFALRYGPADFLLRSCNLDLVRERVCVYTKPCEPCATKANNLILCGWLKPVPPPSRGVYCYLALREAEEVSSCSPSSRNQEMLEEKKAKQRSPPPFALISLGLQVSSSGFQGGVSHLSVQG